MTLIQCPACNENISDTAYDCPKCGHGIKKPTRSMFGKIIKWTFILFNILMIYMMFAGLDGSGDAIEGAASDAEAAGAAVGTAIGATMLIIIWALGDVILGLFVLFTRPKK